MFLDKYIPYFAIAIFVECIFADNSIEDPEDNKRLLFVIVMKYWSIQMSTATPIVMDGNFSICPK